MDDEILDLNSDCHNIMLETIIKLSESYVIVSISNSSDMKDFVRTLRKTENVLFKFGAVYVVNDVLNELTLKRAKDVF